MTNATIDSKLTLGTRETVEVWDRLTYVRRATASEIEVFLSRENQPRAFHFLDRGMDPKLASAFVEDRVIGGLYFRTAYTPEPGAIDVAEWYVRTTGLLPD